MRLPRVSVQLLVYVFCVPFAAAQIANPSPAPQPGTEPVNRAPVEVAKPASNPDDSLDPIELSPFVVTSGQDTGYQAANTLAGSRLNTPIKDLGASISVYTKDLLDDIGATNANQLLIYATGMEAGGPGGNFSNAAGSNIAETNVVGDSVRNAPQSASRSRGLSGPTYSRNFFATDVAVDSYNISSVTVNRGPNAILFGVASPAGVVDTTMLQADLRKNSGKFEFRYGNNDALRTTIDINRVLIPKKLAFRIAALAENEEFNQRPAYEKKRRFYAALNYEPFKSTAFRANMETGNTHANRPFSVLPFNSISPQWYAAGRQAFDWTYYDDPARNPLAASQSSSGNAAALPGRAGEPFRGWFVGQQGFFGPPVFQINDATANGGTISTGFLSSPRTSNATGVVIRNAIINQRFDPVFNRDSAGDGQQFYETKNISEISNDYYSDRRIPAGLKTQGFTNFDAFDFKNQQIDETGRQDDTFHNITLSFEQRAWEDRIGVEFAYFKEHSESRNRNNFFSTQGNANHLRVDVNAYLPDGRPNPNLGRPYADFSQQIFNDDVRDRETMRGTAYLRYDFRDLKPAWAKWLGSHTATFLGERAQRDAIRIQSKFGVFGQYADDFNVDPYNFSRLVHALAYMGPSIIGNNNPLKLQAITMPQIESGKVVNLNLFESPAYSAAESAVVPSPVQQAKLVTVPYTLQQIFRNGFYNRDIIKSKAVNLMSYWLDDLLITNVGWRRDEDYFFQNAPLANATPEGLANINLIRGNFDMFSLPSNPPLGAAREVKSYSAVLRWPQKFFRLPRGIDLSIFYNNSGNFTPNISNTDAFGNVLPSASGKTKEFGFNFSTAQNRLNIRLSRYETTVSDSGAGRNGALGQLVNNVINQTIQTWTQQVNTPGAPSREGDIATLLSALPSDYATIYKFQLSGSASAGNLSRGITSLPNYSDIQDYVSKGVDVDITYNPSKNWRILLNFAKNDVVQSRIAPYTQDLYNRLKPALTVLGNRPKGNANNGYIFPTDPVTGQPNLNAGAGEQTLATYVSQNVDIPLATLLATEGVTNPEIRKYRANLVTNYTFSQGKLRGFGIGTGVRWQDKAAIGYPTRYTTAGIFNPTTGALINAGPVALDIDNPFYAPAQTNVDAFMSYNHKIWKNRVNWTIKFNVQNLVAGDELIPITAQPDGSYASVRLGTERRWFITNSFAF